MRVVFTLAASLLVALNVVRGQAPSPIYYKVTFPNDTTIFGCGASVPTIYPIIDKVGACSINVGVNKDDQIFYTNSCQNCYKIVRRWRLVYWCDYNPNTYLPYIVPNPANTDKGVTAYGDVYNHGYIEYTQVIKVLDNVAPVFVNCPSSPVTICDYSNNNPNLYNNNHIDRCEAPVNLSIKAIDACSKSNIKFTYRLFLDMDGNGTMETIRSSGSTNAWPVETTAMGDTLMGTIKFPQGYELPYGRHKVEWIAGDYCGPESVCKYEIIIKDCKAPTVVCCNGLGANLMKTGMLTLRDSTFLLYANDNCTKAPQLKIGIRKAGTGTGFPTTRDVTFNCDETGAQLVEIWAMDEAGNADFCKTVVNIQDNMGICSPGKKPAGQIVTEYNKGVPDAEVRLLRQSAVQPFDVTLTTDANGRFEAAFIPYNCNFTLTPSLKGPASEGVTALDAEYLAAHIDEVQFLTSPYSIIAGDVDGDRRLTYADVQLIAKMANGSLTDFPGVAAWRFIPQAHDFFSDNPFTYPFPEAILAPCANGDRQNFVAIKTGDVNGTMAQSPKAPGANGRSANTPLLLDVADQAFQAGATVRVPVALPANADLSALQFTLSFAQHLLRLEQVEAGLASAEQIGLFETRGSATVAWFAGARNQNATGTHLFTLVFQAKADGRLSEALDVNSSIAGAVAYGRDQQERPVALNMGSTTTERLQVFHLSPNPTSGVVRVGFRLPAAGDMRFVLTDVQGKSLWATQSTFDKGYSEQALTLPVGAGLYFLRMESAQGSETRKVTVH